MTGKVTSELERILRDLKEKRLEERENLIARIKSEELRVQELLDKIEQLKKLNDEERTHILEQMKQREAHFMNEVGIANEKVRIVEDDNLKYQAELEALKKQLSMENKLRSGEKDAYERKIVSLTKNYDAILAQRQREMAGMDRKMAQAQEKFIEDMSREKAKAETTAQIIKNELESVIREKDAEKMKIEAKRQDSEKTINNFKQETGILKNEIKELRSQLKVQRDDYDMQLRNMDREWEEAVRRKEREKKELVSQMKKLEIDVAGQFNAQLKEAAEEKKLISKKVLDLQRQIEEINLAHERFLVEKDEFYRKQIAVLRDAQIEIENRFQMKEDELNMIKSELETEIAVITGVGRETEDAVRIERSEIPVVNEGLKKKLKKLFAAPKNNKRSSAADSVSELFKEIPARRETDSGSFSEQDSEEDELNNAESRPAPKRFNPADTPEETSKDVSKNEKRPPVDDKKRQITLIISQKEEQVKELEAELKGTTGEKKSELQSRVDGLKVEIEEWHSRLK
ncbi:hypothetical protein FP828_02170 [bacterium]|nr:hypothetical protein [bacterium]